MGDQKASHQLGESRVGWQPLTDVASGAAQDDRAFLGLAHLRFIRANGRSLGANRPTCYIAQWDQLLTARDG